MYSRPRSVSNLSQTFRFPALETKEGLGRHCLNVWRLMSVIVAWLALTRKTEMHGELVFDTSGAANLIECDTGQHLNSLQPSDAIWWQRSGWTLVEVMVWSTAEGSWVHVHRLGTTVPQWHLKLKCPQTLSCLTLTMHFTSWRHTIVTSEG